MGLSRNIGLAAALAGMLVGCSETRWHRRAAVTLPAATSAPDKSPTDKLPGTLTSAKAPPSYSPALYIPGSAESRVAKTDKAPVTPPSIPVSTGTETTLPPLTPSDPGAADNPLLVLECRASAKWASLDGYICRMRRREVVAGQQKPEEIIDAKFRKDPFSVYFRWAGPEGKGREVVFVLGQHDNLIHTLTAPGDVFLLPGGTRFKVAPDSLLVKNKSRAGIIEAGVGSLLRRFSKLVDALERGDAAAGSAKYLGQLKRKEFETKVEGVLQTIAPGWEPLLPNGGQRLWCFDPEHGLPVLIVTHDETQREVEYYCHERFEFPPRFTDDDFNPDRLWQKRPERPVAE